jgi:pimeloyl-ACP methyl ester carboxylesterase
MGDVRGEHRFLAAQLASAGYRAVSLDVRGHGESSPRWPDYTVGAVGADLAALIRHLDGGPAVIVGASMAAGAAVCAAAEAPELVRGLVLIAPFVRGGGGWAGKLLFSLIAARPWGPALWQNYYTSLYPSRKPADFSVYRAALRTNLAEPGRLEALRAMLTASKAASEQRLERLKTPTLVLMGSKDPDFKDQAGEAAWVAQALNGRSVMIPGAGHYPQAEMPEISGPLVVEFIAALGGR